MDSETNPAKILFAESQRLGAFVHFWLRQYETPNSWHELSLTTGLGLRSRIHSKKYIRSLYAPIIVPGSLDNLSGLQIPDPPGNGQLQELAHKTRELLMDGNGHSLRYIRCSDYPCRDRRTKAGARKITSGIQGSIKRILDERGHQLF